MVPERQELVTSWVGEGLAGDDPQPLLALAEAEMGMPLGLVGAGGDPLGWAPATPEGGRATAVATAAVRSHVHAPPGWTIVAIVRGTSALGFLAVGAPAAGGPLLELLAALLGEQLQRAALIRARARAVVQRLVRDPDAGTPWLRREAAEAGVALADTYWLALLTWRKVEPRREVVEAIERQSSGGGDGSLTAVLPGGLLLMRAAVEDDDGERASSWFTHVARSARRLAPTSGAQVIAGESRAELAELSARVAELRALGRLHLRTESEALVVPAQRYALDRLLWRVAPGADRFVADQLGPLLARDVERRADLLMVLEAALDFPRHDRAASHCYMHRNTFRNRLRQAMEVLGRDLEDPDVRLSVHVALRMRRVLEEHAGSNGTVPPAAARGAAGAAIPFRR